MKISVCIIANKLTPRLRDVLLSYKECDELLLGFNGDKQHLVAYEFPTLDNLQVIQQKWNGYGATKNELAAQARNEWILSVDSDEVADGTLKAALQDFSPATNNEIYQLTIRHFFGNSQIKHGAWGRGKTKFLRLYNRSHTNWDTADVHETILVKENSIVKELKGIIQHYTAESAQQFSSKNEHYARLSASKYYTRGKKATWIKRFAAPAFTFLKQYFFQLGFLDGAAGYTIAKGNAKYTFRKYQLLHQLNK